MFEANLFKYYDDAHAKKFEPGWFEKNQKCYQEAVKKPFQDFIQALHLALDENTPLNPKKISRPVRPKNRHQDQGIVKDFTSLIGAKPKPSRFEYPPCIHFQLGALEQDNFLCVGMYLTNTAQIKKFRQALNDDFVQLIEQVGNEWGGLQGDKYKRQPTIEVEKYADFYWFKTFYFNVYFNRQEVISKDFFDRVLNLTETALPFYHRLNSIMLK